MNGRRRVVAPRRAWVTASAAVALGLAVTVESAVRAPASATLVGFVGGFGVAALVVAVLVGLDALIGPAVGFIVAAAALGVTGDANSFDVGIVVDALACFAVAEVAYRSVDGRSQIHVLRGDVAREVAPVVATACAAGAGGVLLLGLATASELPRPPSVTVGVVAVLLLVALVGGRSRR